MATNYTVKVKINNEIFFVNDRFNLSDDRSNAFVFKCFEQAEVVASTFVPHLTQIEEIEKIPAYTKLVSELPGSLNINPSFLKWERFMFIKNRDNVDIIIIDEFNNEICAFKDVIYKDAKKMIMSYVEKSKIDHIIWGE